MSKAEKIKQAIISDICSGKLNEKEPFPTRMLLMQQYSVARATIDRVVRDLSSEGFLRSQQGSGTFIVPREKKPGHFYLVLNTETDCPEASEFHSRLQYMMSDQSLECTLIDNDNLMQDFDRLASSEGNRVIWSRPTLRCYYFIDQLQQRGVRQMIINRVLPGYTWAATDTLGALRQALTMATETQPETSLQLLTKEVDMREPFIQEREVYFSQSLCEKNLPLNALWRRDKEGFAANLRIIRQMLDTWTKGQHVTLFIPDTSMLTSFMTLADERGLLPQRDFTLICYDWPIKQEAGIITLRQRWDEMFEASLEWLKQDFPGISEKLVLPEIITG